MNLGVIKVIAVTVSMSVCLSYTAYSKDAILKGFCGVRFGQVMKEKKNIPVNNIGALVYQKDVINKKFCGATDYRVFATPLTRKVFLIRAVKYTSVDEINREFENIVLFLEKEFGVKGTLGNDGVQVFKYENNSVVKVSKTTDSVMIDAINHEVEKQLNAEKIIAHKRKIEKSLMSLSLSPQEKDEAGKLNDIKSVFKVTFGKNFKSSVKGSNFLSPVAGSWKYKFTLAKPFLGCSDCFALATARSKRVFLIGMRFQEGDFDAKMSEARYVIEEVTGRKMTEVNGGKTLSLRFEDNIIRIEKKLIYVEMVFIKNSLYESHLHENGS